MPKVISGSPSQHRRGCELHRQSEVPGLGDSSARALDQLSAGRLRLRLPVVLRDEESVRYVGRARDVLSRATGALRLDLQGHRAARASSDGRRPADAGQTQARQTFVVPPTGRADSAVAPACPAADEPLVAVWSRVVTRQPDEPSRPPGRLPLDRPWVSPSAALLCPTPRTCLSASELRQRQSEDLAAPTNRYAPSGQALSGEDRLGASPPGSRMVCAWTSKPRSPSKVATWSG